MRLRYGMNPQQAAACATPVMPGNWPVRVVHGQPSLINMLDALGAWQLVREAGQLLGKPAAASFKHTSPAGAAVAGPVDEVAADYYGADGGISGVASAYLRARDADPKSSYGDFAAVSCPVDAHLAGLLAGVVCDGVIAPGYEPGRSTRSAGRRTAGSSSWRRTRPSRRPGGSRVSSSVSASPRTAMRRRCPRGCSRSSPGLP
jgi:AICAR transformylase/IMP cyclohydrolase PurH